MAKVQELGLSAPWLEMREEAWIRMLSGEALPTDPLTFFKQWYDFTSEIWLKLVGNLIGGNLIGTEMFVETAGRFFESGTSFSQTFRRASEEYWRMLQIPTRSDIARLAELVVKLEDKVDRGQDAFDAVVAGFPQVATRQAVGALEDRLREVENKVDQLPSVLERTLAGAHLAKRLDQVEQIEDGGELQSRLSRVESKMDQLLTAFEHLTTSPVS